MSGVRNTFWDGVARGRGGSCSPRKYGWNCCIPAVVRSTERSSGGGTSDAEGTLRWSRSPKNDRKRERISAAFTERESRYVSEGALTIDCLPADSTRAMDLEGLVAEARERRPQPMPPPGT